MPLSPTPECARQCLRSAPDTGVCTNGRPSTRTTCGSCTFSNNVAGYGWCELEQKCLPTDKSLGMTCVETLCRSKPQCWKTALSELSLRYCQATGSPARATDCNTCTRAGVQRGWGLPFVVAACCCVNVVLCVEGWCEVEAKCFPVDNYGGPSCSVDVTRPNPDQLSACADPKKRQCWKTYTSRRFCSGSQPGRHRTCITCVNAQHGMFFSLS